MISRLAAAGLRCYAAVLLLLLPAMLHADALEQKSARRKHEMVLSRPTPKWDKPTEAAEQWDYAMPTGNGRVGALVFGNITNETILLNHDSLCGISVRPPGPRLSQPQHVRLQ